MPRVVKTCIPTTTLLLSYTYFLNCDKSISIGYDSKTFKTVLVLNQVLLINQLEWYSLCVKFPLIKKFLVCAKKQANGPSTSSDGKKTYRASTTLHIQASVHDNVHVTLIRSNGPKIILNESEFHLLCALEEFISAVIMHNRTTETLVEAYYGLYLTQCKELGVNKLETPVYYPSTATSSVNYSRLFFEIPILCKDDIIREINKIK